MEARLTFATEKLFAKAWNASAHVGAHPLMELPMLVGGLLVHPVGFPATVAAFYSMSPQDAADLLVFYGLPAIPAAGRGMAAAQAVLPQRRAAVARHIGLILN